MGSKVSEKGFVNSWQERADVDILFLLETVRRFVMQISTPYVVISSAKKIF